MILRIRLLRLYPADQDDRAGSLPGLLSLIPSIACSERDEATPGNLQSCGLSGYGGSLFNATKPKPMSAVDSVLRRPTAGDPNER